jgi:RNA recognition motif-containing protein
VNIYIGNLSPKVTEDDLKEAFRAFGALETVNVVKDRFNGEPRGYGFVDMPSKDEAQAAISGLNGTDLKGQSLKVNEARSRSGNSRGGGRRS